MVRRFLLQCLVLAAPMFLFFGLIAWVDPFDLFGHGGPLPRTLKVKNLDHSGRTVSFNTMLWKLIDFRRSPSPNILLGDSRLSYFDAKGLEERTGEMYYNFGIPGGNYTTLLDLFSYADSLSTLDKVYVQVSFRNMSRDRTADIYDHPRALLDAPFRYVADRRVIEATGLNLFSLLMPGSVTYISPTTAPWTMKLDDERIAAEHFDLDTGHYARLQIIADRCSTIGATLVLVEYPTHPDRHGIPAVASLQPQREEYLARIRRIAPLIDLDRPDRFPNDKKFWRDPIHLTPEGQRLLTQLVWGPSP